MLVAVALAIFGLYQSGDGGKAWTGTMAISRGVVRLTIADLILLPAAAVAGVLAFALSYRRRS